MSSHMMTPKLYTSLALCSRCFSSTSLHATPLLPLLCHERLT